MDRIASRPTGTEAAPLVRIVLLTGDRELGRTVAAAVADMLTHVRTLGTVGQLEALESIPDLVILDASMRRATGMPTLLHLRRRWPSVSVVAVSVDSEETATRLLDNGVDDAIELRSSAEYVRARLGAIARRARTMNAQLRRRVGDVVYDRDNGRVWCAGEEVEFSPRELALLDALWSRAGEVVNYDSLHDYVWSGVGEEPAESNRVEVYISYVRRKLRRSNEVMIETMRGVGYRLRRKDE